MSERINIKTDTNIDYFHLPTVALRGLVIFPDSVVHFDVGREKSINAINEAMKGNRLVYLVPQADITVEDPSQADIYDVGVLASVKQILKHQDGVIKVMVEALERAKTVDISNDGDYLTAIIKPYPVKTIRSDRLNTVEALVRTIKEKFEEYLTVAPKISRDIIGKIFDEENPNLLREALAATVMFKVEDKMNIMAENSVEKRLKYVLEYLNNEIEVLKIESEIKYKVHSEMDKSQREYYLRQQIKTISDELGDGEDTTGECDEYREKIAAANMGNENKEKLLKEVNRLEKMMGSSQEAAVIRTYLDTVLSLPWNESTKEQLDIKKAETILNRDHYGLDKVKEKVLEILAIRQISNDTKGQILCLVGPPGVGKTSIAKSVAECLGRNYRRLSLGGVRDESEIRGHRGDPAAALLEVLDSEQNNSFVDHYIDLPFDLSKVFFIATANDRSSIPGPLLDRMDVIELPSYTREEKFNIAKKHLIPKQLDKNSMKSCVKFNDAAIYEIIDCYTREAGVRNLERTIVTLLRKCAKEILSDDIAKITLTKEKVKDLLGVEKFKRDENEHADLVGVANGLAWTSVGGEMLPIEVALIPTGSGKLEITGNLGKVMEESCRIALSYIKANKEKYGIKYDFSKIDLHIHAPEGAVPKDGPSAGVTITTALLSVLTDRKIKGDVAMTGEVSLQGRILPIGGLREKRMAAYREGMKTVIIPYGNKPNLEEVDAVVKEKIKFIPVKTVDRAISVNMN